MATVYKQILTDVDGPNFSPLITGRVLEFSDIPSANQLTQRLRDFLHFRCEISTK